MARRVFVVALLVALLVFSCVSYFRRGSTISASTVVVRKRRTARLRRIFEPFAFYESMASDNLEFRNNPALPPQSP